MTIIDKCCVVVGIVGVVTCFLTENWTGALWAIAYTIQTASLIAAKGAYSHLAKAVLS